MPSIGLSIGRIHVRAGSAGISLTAPVLTWTTAETDNTPEFEVDLVDPAVNDVITLQWDNNSDFSSPIDDDANTLDAGEISTLPALPFTTGALSDGTYYFRANHARGASTSGWSNTETVTIAAATSVGEAIGLLLTLTKAA